MCGIFGFKLRRPLNQNDIDSSLQYLALLKNRGPDNQGYFSDKQNGIFLGHTRLSIIDLSPKSNQPFIIDGSVIVYNGEIYNYKELRNNFHNKFFFTNSDTEVLLNLWKENKINGLRKIDGMFAFAIYENKEIILGTDYFGEKPIYYVNNHNGFYFSSEPKVLIKYLNLKKSLNQNKFEEFLSLGFILSPETGYEELKVLEQNSLIKINYKNEIERSKIFLIKNISLINKKKTLEKKDYDEFKDIFLRSLERRLIADVPIGVLLSSGVDSSLIIASLVREFNIKPLTFTASFEDGIDEAPEANELSKYLGLENIKIKSTSNNIWKKIDKNSINLYSVLNDNISGLYIKEICDVAKKYIKVGLTGIGGDELFYGYNTYDFINKYKFLYDNSKLIKKISKILYKFIKIKKINDLNNLFFTNNYHNYVASKNRHIGKLINGKHLILNHNHAIKENDMIEFTRMFDFKHSLFSSYLTSADRGSMSSSIELRTPFLSLELLNFSNRFHPNIFKNKKKIFIKKLLKDYIPDRYINKKKIGFNFPLKKFLKNKQVNYRTNLPMNFVNEINRNIENKYYDKIAIRLLMIERFEKQL